MIEQGSWRNGRRHERENQRNQNPGGAVEELSGYSNENTHNVGNCYKCGSPDHYANRCFDRITPANEDNLDEPNTQTGSVRSNVVRVRSLKLAAGDNTEELNRNGILKKELEVIRREERQIRELIAELTDRANYLSRSVRTLLAEADNQQEPRGRGCFKYN